MMYRVTYFNNLMQQTCMLIDELDKQTADLVFARFGDANQPIYYMGEEVKVESYSEVQS